MEYRAAIYRNISKLKRIASEVFAMAGFDGMNPPEPIARGKYGIARHVYNAVMALLRPAEAATRRLIIAMAREVKVKPPKPRPRPQRRRFVPRPRTTGGEWVASTVQEAVLDARPTHPRFKLLDPRLRLSRPGQPWRGPRIRSFDEPPKPILPPPLPAPPRPKPRPDDLVDPAKLVGRLVALCDALDDMPKQAERYARWRARRAAGQTRRFTPIRGLLQDNGHPGGRLPGARAVPVKPGAKRPRRIRDIDEVLDSANYLAWNAMRPDTS